MSRELLGTPAAHAGLGRASGRTRDLLDGALAALRRDPCSERLKSYRLRGEPPWAHLCRLNVGATTWRIVYAIGPKSNQVTVICIGRHDETKDDVYVAAAEVLGVLAADAKQIRGSREKCCRKGQPQRLTGAEAARAKTRTMSPKSSTTTA